MYPYPYPVLLEYQRFREDEDGREQRRIRDAALDANEVMAEREFQGRFAAAVSRLRERWPRLSPRASRPMEPSGV